MEVEEKFKIEQASCVEAIQAVQMEANKVFQAHCIQEQLRSEVEVGKSRCEELKRQLEDEQKRQVELEEILSVERQRRVEAEDLLKDVEREC